MHPFSSRTTTAD